MDVWTEFIGKHYEENSKKLKKRLYFSCGDGAEDVLHSAYENALRYKSSYNELKDFNIWFNTIIRNCIKAYKREERGRTESQLSQNIDEYDFIGANCGGVHDKIWREILQLMDEKSLDHQEVLGLYFYLGYSYKDIEAVTNYTYFNIFKIVSGFKQKLRRRYDKG
jgi:RNA polymerase sigma factor (sigma-70 family)